MLSKFVTLNDFFYLMQHLLHHMRLIKNTFAAEILNFY